MPTIVGHPMISSEVNPGTISTSVAKVTLLGTAVPSRAGSTVRSNRSSPSGRTSSPFATTNLPPDSPHDTPSFCRRFARLTLTASAVEPESKQTPCSTRSPLGAVTTRLPLQTSPRSRRLVHSGFRSALPSLSADLWPLAIRRWSTAVAILRASTAVNFIKTAKFDRLAKYAQNTRKNHFFKIRLEWSQMPFRMATMPSGGC